MADKHPYVSAPGNLVQAFTQFRKSFPSTVSADTLKKLSIAPNNESYVLNVLRHLKLIDEQGQKTDAAKVFNLHDDAAFNKEFSGIVRAAYSELFELHGEGAWNLDSSSLIAFFRNHDQTTAIVGQRQANTFVLLAAYAGHGNVPEGRSGAKRTKEVAKPIKSARPATIPSTKQPPVEAKPPNTNTGSVGLTVRIEINLPAGGDQDTYDRIFRSIRENLINGTGTPNV